jgi:DnaJ-class molecular chaperone
MKSGFQQVIKAEPGYVICDKCDGTGIVVNNSPTPFWYQSDECKKCKGEGVVDWITNITGGVLDEYF